MYPAYPAAIKVWTVALGNVAMGRQGLVDLLDGGSDRVPDEAEFRFQQGSMADGEIGRILTIGVLLLQAIAV